ncbi:hypothetical protein LHJ74_22965 [Streptomyces sp. N2-109]|uniref:Integral membrane protein n=1 Tax=Streptomyces gossypii TaxID=2883101 RepID=A0ABT2JXW1_9ACTN|nr:hypothetical protein [Streptomyces gossypii]MCT2592738.1 hypothetical protein [Streptomyces gossypii]
MGIESEQLVFDYLSRVGDLAHGTAMTAAERARLVSGLRGEIDRMRLAEGGAQTKIAVRKILSRLGEPEEVVAAANGGTPLPRPRATEDDSGAAAGGSVGEAAAGGSAGGSAGRPAYGADPPKARPRLPKLPRLPQQLRKEPEPPPEGPPPPTAAYGASPPHLAGMDELGPQESDPDWWRVDPGPYGGDPGSFGGGGERRGGRRPGEDLMPGFVGGIEMDELFKTPQQRQAEADAEARAEAAAAAAAGEGADAVSGEATGKKGGGGGKGLLGRVLGGRGGAAESGPAAGGIVELLACGLLVAGAFMGSLVPLALGWLAAYWSPKLSRNEAKWAAFGMPALALGAGATWLWGREGGRWGAPIEEGGEALRQAMTDTWPVVLRAAAVASALFLLWRARRRPGKG